MREEANVTSELDAPPAECFAVAADIASYPEWAADVKSAEVLESDAEGRPVSVHFRAAAMGRSTSYTLRYDWSDAPHGLSWSQESGDATKVLTGSWRFDAVDDEPGRTIANYRLEVELLVPLPGFVKRRAEGRITSTAFDDFRARVESAA